MHDWYEWLKDIALPAFAGLGSIAVGAVAAVVARQSHNLAKQVRDDEVKRNAEASRDRYRDQLFRAAEPAITAMIEYTNEVNTAHEVDSAAVRKLRSVASARLQLLQQVTVGDDRTITDTVLFCFFDLSKQPLWQVRAYVASGLAGQLATVVAEERDTDESVSQIRGLIAAALAAYEASEGRYLRQALWESSATDQP